MNSAEERLRRVQERIQTACRGCGRKPEEITLVAAGKTVSADRLQEFYAAGLSCIGENYVQEALPKMAQMQGQMQQSSTRWSRLEWHLIGALQSNKAREAVGRFTLIHSVDRARLAQALNKEAQAQGIRQAVLLQVNIGDEAGKAGCGLSELNELAQFCLDLPALEVRGLMCLPPQSDDPHSARPYFQKLRDLRDRLQSSTRTAGLGSELSMGMTNDFEVAIEEGATLIRIGTGLFGPRSRTV
ncbi:MAG TPA: YggS family pyridoxal phosphate-dependent enzyme [Abditibacteriaceae bacterium]|nr:YggS family pyridoxal phosphate-dependent enzyme [Abditibacteriaceae bacterium]